MSIVTVALTLVFASATPAVAKSVECFEDGSCVVRCSQTTPNGNFIEYDEGTTITVTDADGNTYKFKCVNGNWVQQTASALQPTLLGILNYKGSLAGVKGDITERVYEDDSLNVLLKTTVYKIGSAADRDPGCDPNTVGCPG